MENKRYTPEEVLNLQSQAYQKGYNEGYELRKSEQPGPRWVKASERLPEQKREVIFRKKEVSRTAKPFYVNEYLFNLIVEGVILIEYYIGCPLSEIEWLDESGAAAAGREEDNAVEFAEWRDENYIPVYRSIQYWIPKLPEHSNDVEPYTADQLYELFKKQKEK